jgi:hypothetical protein
MADSRPPMNQLHPRPRPQPVGAGVQLVHVKDLEYILSPLLEGSIAGKSNFEGKFLPETSTLC